MCKIKINATVFLIILQIFLVATAAFEETNESDGQMAEKCCSQTYETVNPLLDYFRQVRNELEDSEIKAKKLNELNSDLMQKYHEIVRIHEKFMKEAALLDEYKNKVLNGENDLQSCQNNVNRLGFEINSQQNIIAKLKIELAVKSTNLENCELQFQILNSSLIEKDENIKILSANIQNITEHQKTIELQVNEKKTMLIKQDEDIKFCQSEIDTLNRTSKNIRKQQKNIQLKLKECETKLIDKVKENQLCQSELDKLGSSTCIPFGDSDVHQLNVSGVGFFDVLCDSQLAGPGWIVIQQRVGGNEDFDRDWATYRKGFGSYKSDFFLGLEKIHRITSLQRHELYIHLVALNGSIYNAHYDNFIISDEDSGYKLSLGKFKGTIIKDAMRTSENKKFATLDHEIDIDVASCANDYASGWWYNDCYNCNLNAPYGPDLNWWANQLEEAKMLIRPKEAMKK